MYTRLLRAARHPGRICGSADIITKFDGEKVKNGDDLKKMLTYYKAGSTVTMTVQSLENGKYVERNVQITLGLQERYAAEPG